MGRGAVLCLGGQEPNHGQRQTQRPGAPVQQGCLSTGRPQGRPCWAAELVLSGGWRSRHPGPLVWDAVPGPRGERMVAPGAWAFRPPQCSRQQALAESGLDCGALARRQLAAATAAHLIFHSSPNHHPAHPRPPQALVKYMEEGVLQGGHQTALCPAQPYSSKATWAGDLSSLSLSFPAMTQGS